MIGIVLAVVGGILLLGALIYLLWPSIVPMLRRPSSVPPPSASVARGSGPASTNTKARAGGELPPLFAAL